MADFTETRLGKIFIKSIAAGFVALMVSSILFGAANFVLELLLGYDGPWKTAICVTCAAFLPWYMLLHEIENRPKKAAKVSPSLSRGRSPSQGRCSRSRPCSRRRRVTGARLVSPKRHLCSMACKHLFWRPFSLTLSSSRVNAVAMRAGTRMRLGRSTILQRTRSFRSWTPQPLPRAPGR